MFHTNTLDLPCGWPLRKLENWLFLGTKIRTSVEQTIAFLKAKWLWKPEIHRFISAGFVLSLSCSVPCGTEQTTQDTGCGSRIPRNCVDHPTDCNLFQKCNPIKFPIIRPSTLNKDKNLWNLRGVPDETTCLTGSFWCPSSSTLICMQFSNVCANSTQLHTQIRNRYQKHISPQHHLSQLTVYHHDTWHHWPVITSNF